MILVKEPLWFNVKYNVRDLIKKEITHHLIPVLDFSIWQRFNMYESHAWLQVGVNIYDEVNSRTCI